MNAAVVCYTHHSRVVLLSRPLHREERASITLIMCTTNNCLVERASTSLESRLEKRLALVDRSDNYYLPSQHSDIIDTVKSIGMQKDIPVHSRRLDNMGMVDDGLNVTSNTTCNNTLNTEHVEVCMMVATQDSATHDYHLPISCFLQNHTDTHTLNVQRSIMWGWPKK